MRVGSWAVIEPKDGIDHEKVKSMLWVNNPDYLSAVYIGKDTTGIPRMDPLFVEEGDLLYVPRDVWRQLVEIGGVYGVEDETSLGDHEVDFGLKFVPRPGQDEWVEMLYRKVLDRWGAIGQAPAGSGKTVMALAVAAKLGRPVGVLVHTEFLMEQWIERVKALYSIPESRIGIVQEAQCDYKGKDIVVMMAQSLLSRRYADGFYRYFGTLITDEVHRFGARLWRQAIVQFPTRYRIGVSATPRRKDKLEKVFLHHIGPIGAEMGYGYQLKPEVKMVKTGLRIPPDRMKWIMWNGKVQWARLDNYLMRHKARNGKIVYFALEAARAGRRILVLSSRRNHLAILRSRLEEKMKEAGESFTMSYMVGSMDSDLREQAKEAQIILGTYQMVKEAFDLPELDTEILATPIADIEQAVGRILRENGKEKRPMVIDLVDELVTPCIRRANARKKQYKQLGYI